MSEMQSVGMKDFRTNLYKYTRGTNEPLALTSRDEIIGYFIPAASTPDEKDMMALRNAVKSMSESLAKRGLTEDDIVADFQELRRKSRLSEQ